MTTRTELPERAKVAVFRKPGEPLEIRELPLSPPREGEVLVKVLRANVCGSDLHMLGGEAFAGFGVPFPFVLGHELCGRVALRGEGVSCDTFGNALSEGDLCTFAYYRGCGACRLCARGDEHACLTSLMSLIRPVDEPPHFVGGFGEYYLVRRGQAILKLYAGTPPSLAAGINCALAQVMHGLDTVGLRYGENVVIQGAGGLGLYATAVAKQLGAAKVIVVDGIAARLELAHRLGADATISLTELADPRKRTERARDLTGGGADVVVEVVGHADALREGVRMLARGGRYLVMGAINPKQTTSLDPSLWIGQNLRLFGVSLYPAAALARAAAFVAHHAAKIPLDAMLRAFPFRDIEAAIAAARDRSSGGRVQLVMEDAA